jgi:hypothetical protein
MRFFRIYIIVNFQETPKKPDGENGSAGNQLGKKYFLRSGSFLGYSPGMKLTGTVA